MRRLAAVFADVGRHFNERTAAGFARGALLDQADRFDEAFACFAEANALARRTLVEKGRGYDAAAMRRRIDRLIADYPRDMLAATAAAGSASERPVFIVGMPRSGTTLVEQIAASHPLIFGAGELTDIARIADLLPPAPRGPEAAARWAAMARPLGDAHLTRLAGLGGPAARVTDKQPDNLLHLGLIATLFPAARIVLCERDPRDICLSNYFQLFAGGNPWSYALEDCGQRWREVSRLTEHWRRVLPLAMHTVRYETLVGDLEGETRRLLAFLAWSGTPPASSSTAPNGPSSRRAHGRSVRGCSPIRWGAGAATNAIWDRCWPLWVIQLRADPSTPPPNPLPEGEGVRGKGHVAKAKGAAISAAAPRPVAVKLSAACASAAGSQDPGARRPGSRCWPAPVPRRPR